MKPRDLFPGRCPRCGFEMTLILVTGDSGATPPRKDKRLVSCTRNPRGCPYPTETFGECIKRRYIARWACS